LLVVTRMELVIGCFGRICSVEIVVVKAVVIDIGCITVVVERLADSFMDFQRNNSTTFATSSLINSPLIQDSSLVKTANNSYHLA